MTTLHQLQSALNHRSPEQLRDLLAPDFHLGGLPSEMSIAGVMAGLPATNVQIVDVQILSLHRTASGYRVEAGLYERHIARGLKLGIAPNGKILWIGEGKPEAGSHIDAPDVFASAFVPSGGLIYVRVKVNGRDGYFLVDTGSSGWLLNQRYFAPEPARRLLALSVGAHGVRTPIGQAEVASFAWGKMKAGHFEAEIKDLSNFETPKITPLLGAIGQAQLRDRALLVDWRRELVQIKATNRNGSPKVPDPARPLAVVPFDYFLHLPAFAAKVGNRSYTMLFDSGCSSTIFPNRADLGSHFRQTGSRVNLSDGSTPRNLALAFGVVDAVTIGKLALADVPVIVYPIPYLGDRAMLGTPLFAVGKIEINFRARQIRIFP